MKTIVRFAGVFIGLLVCSTVPAAIINEFAPNPLGGDPSNQTIELKFTPGTAVTDWFIVSIEGTGNTVGQVERLTQFSGTFDANGLLEVGVSDLENPTFTLVVLGSDATVQIGDDVAANPGLLGTVFDAIGVRDDASTDTVYGANLGGTDLAFVDFNGNSGEPTLVFRDGLNDDLYQFGPLTGGAASSAFDAQGNEVSLAAFDITPTDAGSFGVVNPTAVPEPSSLACLGVLGAGAAYRRVRRRKTA